ncbi:hypothetical protein [Archangium sp.]|uniref:hypothetical protein n=1 Tax=Archangium sp. TaxID=1872627 RepID=UPI00286A31B9|nr:hypothetical protein [Archangium sp.]
MDNNLSELAARLKAKLDGAKDLLIPEDELVELMNNDLDKVSAASAHISCHMSSHGSIGREMEDAV